MQAVDQAAGAAEDLAEPVDLGLGEFCFPGVGVGVLVLIRVGVGERSRDERD